MAFMQRAVWVLLVMALVACGAGPSMSDSTKTETPKGEVVVIEEPLPEETQPEISVPEQKDPPSITIWLAGDSTVAPVANSITCTGNSGADKQTGWGAKLQAYFNNKVTVVNSAVGGRSVRSWLYETTDVADATGECIRNKDASGEFVLQSRWTYMLSNMEVGDYLFIQFGINDGTATCGRHVGSAAFIETYGVMSKAAKARGVQPVFVTPANMIRCQGSAAVNARGFIAETVQAGKQFDVPVLDLTKKSTELYNRLGFCPNDVEALITQDGNKVGDFFCNDHTHFAPSGAAQIAGLIAEGIQELYLPLSSYLVGINDGK